jgi:hypothetical protein
MSPVIPTYESKELPHGNVEAAKIPLSYAKLAPSAALEHAGEEVSNIATQWGKKLEEAQQAHQVSTGMANFQTQAAALYHQITSSPDFKQNPDSGNELWKQKVGELHKSILDQTKDPLAKQHLDNQMTLHSVSYTNDVNHAVRTTQVDQLRAGGVENLSKFGNAAISAPSAQSFHDSRKGGLATLDGLYHSGAIDAEKYVEQRSKFIENTLHQRAQREAWENPQALIAKLNDPKSEYAQIKNKDGDVVYQGLSEKTKDLVIRQAEKRSTALLHEARAQDRYEKEQQAPKDYEAASKNIFSTYNLTSANGDFDKAWDDVHNPANWSTWGLTEKTSRSLCTDIRAQKQHVDNVEAQKAGEVSDRFRDSVIKGETNASNISSYTDKKTKEKITDPKDIEWAQKHIASDDKAKNRTDPSVYADARQRILDPDRDDHISDRKDIDDLRLHGLSNASADKLDKLRQTAQDPAKAPEFKTALKMYDKAHKDDWADANNTDDVLAVSAKRNAFIQSLTESVGEDKLSGPAILDKAGELMKGEVYKPQGKDASSTGKLPLPERPEPGGKKATQQPQQAEEKQKPKFIGIDKKTGAPAFQLPDGSKIVDTTQKPQLVGHDKNTGEPIYQAPDGRMFTVGKGSEKQENEITEPDDIQPLVPGNIDYNTRPVVKNKDGSVSSVQSSSFEIEGKEVLLPTLDDDGRKMTNKEVVEKYKKDGKHLGIFNTAEEADAYAAKHHSEMGPQDKIEEAMQEQRGKTKRQAQTIPELPEEKEDAKDREEEADDERIPEDDKEEPDEGEE